MNEHLTNSGPAVETGADRHRRLSTAFLATVAAVSDSSTGNPTPCDGWTIADVIDHVANTQRDFLAERGIAVPTDATLATVSATMQSVLDDPAIADAVYDGYFGPTSIAETVDAFYCLDLVLHRWDIAVAAELDGHSNISDIDIERCRALMTPMGDNIRMPGIFGDEVDPGLAPTASASFVAWAGRDPAFSAAD